MMSRRRLINELRRRNVLRAVIAYWVVAWTGIEICALIEQALLLPDWLDQMSVIIGMAGLPVVIAISWKFEWGPAGLVAEDGGFPQRRVTDRQDELASRIASEVYRHLAEDAKRSGSAV